MHVSSDPMTHRPAVGGDFAMDVNMPGMMDAGEPAAFDVVPANEARSVRGVVVRGGARPG
jgi:hypothetical protein